MQKEKIALRIDDIFASTKQFEVYGKETVRLGGKTIPISFLSNFLFLKYSPGLKKRLPYREMTVAEWKQVFAILKRHDAKLTIGITAVWVEKNGSLKPFFVKYPGQSRLLRSAMQEGLIEIANHGFTHCVKGKHLPRPFSSNRTFHREFWDWVNPGTHKEHMEKSQDLLLRYFGSKPLTFIPPGSVWTRDTEKYAFENGIRYLSSRESKCPTGKKSNGLLYLGEAKMIAFHDREIILNGIGWFEKLLEANSDKKIVTIKELGESINGG